MTGGEILGLIAIVVMIGTAAILAAAETALTRISTARAEALVEEDRRGSKVLRRLVEDRESVLNPLLFVILGCQLGAATIVAVLADRRWGTGGVVVALTIELIVLFIVAESLPKSWALAHPDRSATAMAPVARVVYSIAPLRWLANGVARVVGFSAVEEDPDGDVAEEELLALAEEAAASAAIDEDERVLIESIIEFGDTVTAQIMVPRLDMVVVDAEFRIGDAIEIVILNGYSRVPVYREGIDDIAGIVHAKDLMRADRDGNANASVATIMREARFVPESKRIAELLREMQAEMFHLAIVVDEHGGTSGLVTLEDLIEEVVGEIVDEFDVEQPMIERLGDQTLRINGRVPLDDLEDLLGVELPEGEWSTVGGLIFNSLGHVPVEGESLELDSHTLLVERVQGRRIARVLVSPLGPSATNGNGSHG
ncbi:MAG: hemolysin family protein [Acidimicrobiales bacterium]